MGDSDTECGGCTPAKCRRKHNDGDTSSGGENMDLVGASTDNPQGTTEGAGCTTEDADVDDCDPECGECTPATCRRKHNDGDTSSDGENIELTVTPTDNPQGTTEGAGCTTEDAESKDGDEESADITDEEEEEGIEDLSHLGAGTVAVKLQTVQQDSYRLVEKDTRALAQHVVGCCQQPQGEIALTSQQGTQIQTASVVDVDQTTSQAQLSSTTSCVVPNTPSLQDPTTTALTSASTSSLLPRIPGSVVSEMQSSGLPVVPVTGDSPVVAQYNLIQVRQQFGDVTVQGARNLTIGGTQNVGTPQTRPEEEEKPLTAGQKIRNTRALAQHVVGCCQQPQGEIALTSQQGTQIQTASVVDVDQTTSQAQLSSTTSCVVPNTPSLQDPTTTALTSASTSSLLPRIPGSVKSEIQSSGLPVVPVTGDSPVVAQYNLIQLRQQFGDVTVQGARNLNIGGTQNVGTPQTNQEEEEKPLTPARKIRKRTESRIQSMTKDMVETEVLQEVTEKLDSGATWVTIEGRPGEGKSTIAYMALKDQHTQGRQVYQVVSPEEFNVVIMASTNPVIMLDDIFGDLEFDVAEWAKWRPSLRPFVDLKDPDKTTEKDSMDKSTKSKKERTKDEQTLIKRTAPNKGKTIIILVGRDYVLKSSLADLGRMADYISSPQYVVEVSSQRDSNERRNIWHVHAKTKNIDFDESTVSQICQSDCPHGFPHVCKMFVTTYEKDQTQLPVDKFFQAPLAFLKQTLDKFLKDEIKVSLFKAMIKRDGQISGQELEQEDAHGHKYITAADDLAGSYLKKEADTYMFDHPSIYDCVALILSTKQSKFVIDFCSLSFIHQRLRLKASTRPWDNVPGETDLVANISWNYAQHLARRFATEISRSNLLHVLSHQACCNPEFIDLLMGCLNTQCHMSVSDIPKLADNSSEQSFFELVSSSKSHHLIKSIMEKENRTFSQRELRDILLGVCMNAACSVLTYISEHQQLEIDARYGWKEKTPLMLAAETKDSVFVNQILALHPDLYARERQDQTVFQYLCANGLTSAVEHAINMGVDVHEHHPPVVGPYPQDPLSRAIENGHVGVVELLLKKGCDVDKQRGLECALRSQNTHMTRFLLDRGAQVGGDSLHIACLLNNLSIIKMLFEEGAKVDMISSDGDTPLHSACGRNPDVVLFLLEKGAHVNVQNNTGDTPLHTASWDGYTECVGVLLKAGANVNVQNNTGDRPLHNAAWYVSTGIVDALLKAGASVNVQNNTGDTPLHKAAAATIWNQSTEVVVVLLKAGGNVNVQNNTGDTPLHKAAAATAWIESTEIVVVLLKAGADVNAQINTGDTPLHKAAAAARDGYTNSVVALLQAGANVDVQNDTGDTPLHKAAAVALDESAESADVLLQAGANVNVQNNTGDTPLHKAAAVARDGYTYSLSALLQAGANVNVQNDTGDTPLHAAAFNESAECFHVLLQAGANVNVQNNTGVTPLHKAAWGGYTECVVVLLKAEAHVNVQHSTGDTPLHEATAGWNASTENIVVLLKAGAYVNVQNNTGDTPLHKAAAAATAENESTEIVVVLLKAGADVNVQNNTGDTPLHKAAATTAGIESTEIVDALLQAGANVNVQNGTGDTPLHKVAAEALYGYTGSVGALLKAGASVNVQNNTCDTPLHKAAAVARDRYTECVVALLQAGANVNVQNDTGDTPLHAAALDESVECVDVLLKAGANVNVQNNTGLTSLHKAAWGGYTECVVLLLKAGANVNVQNSTGDTPLHKAAAALDGSAETIVVLLKAGAYVNVENNTGDTPLQEAAAAAAWNASTEIVVVLLKAGANVNVQNNTGDTPLHAAAAAWGGSAVWVDALLKAGASVNVQNNTGDTPLHKATRYGSTECVELLLKAGADVNVQNNTGDTPSIHLPFTHLAGALTRLV